MRVSAFGSTDRGIVRQRNEDSFLLDEVNKVYAVADGLGGLPRGALASNLAIECLKEQLAEPESRRGVPIDRAVARINQRVYEEGGKISKDLGIGTTLTLLKIDGGKGLIAHIGDCALFRFRNGGSEQLTTDHTMMEEVKAKLYPDIDYEKIPESFAHTLTRCIGQQRHVEADIKEIELLPGDRLLLCSDGITKTAHEDEIAEMAKSAGSAEELVTTLIATANERGGPDNSTAIALFLD